MVGFYFKGINSFLNNIPVNVVPCERVQNYIYLFLF